MSNDGQSYKRRGIMGAIGDVDREGWLAVLAAIVLAILLGMILNLFFWIGMIAAVVLYLATRGAKRVSPPNGYVSPVDGQVISIEEAVPPLELKLGTEPMQRIRIASSPISTNPIWSATDVTFASQIIEEGDPQKFYAGNPDQVGLKKAFLGFETASGKGLGLIVTTGALGPRLDVDARMGQELKTGDQLGKCRLGGWCDVYLPLGTEFVVRPGQTLIGAETHLAVQKETRRVAADISDVASSELEDVVREAEDLAEDTPAAEKTDDTVTDTDIASEIGSDDPEKEAAKQFERLKRETEKKSD